MSSLHEALVYIDGLAHDDIFAVQTAIIVIDAIRNEGVLSTDDVMNADLSDVAWKLLGCEGQRPSIAKQNAIDLEVRKTNRLV